MKLVRGQALESILAVTVRPIRVFDAYRNVANVLADEVLRMNRQHPMIGYAAGSRIKAATPIDGKITILFDHRGAGQSASARPGPWNAANHAAASHEKHRYARRERVANAIGVHSDAEWQELLERTGRQCLRCLIPEGETRTGKLTKDHVVSLANGGTDYISNIQPLCGPCNSWKGKSFVDFRTETQAA